MGAAARVRPLHLLLAMSAVPVLAGLVRLGQLALMQPLSEPRFSHAPMPVVLHVLSSITYIVGGAFQFNSAARTMMPARHRRLGWRAMWS